MITAEVHDDTNSARANFDATAWFEQAKAEDILKLAQCDWGGDYPADAVAEFFDGKNDEVSEVFQLTHGGTPTTDANGFECHVNDQEAMAWLKANRPEVHAAIQEYQAQTTSDPENFFRQPKGTQVAVESLQIDGENDEGTMAGCDAGEAGFHAPFALFSPDLQHNVGGPYALREHAQAAIDAIQQGKMVPYTNHAVTWTVNGKPSPWYDKD